MKLSQVHWQTFKEVPAEAEIPSHQLMIRAGLIHKSGSGLYNFLPFGWRIIRKIEQIVREELEKKNCLEMQMTVVTPGELWQKSGRWDKMGGLMLKFKDKGDRDLCISPTNEEAITDIFSKQVKSYKNLPVSMFQMNTKFRDEIRPRFGLMRAREFIMKDAYTFDIDKAGMDKSYDALYEAYMNIFNRMGFTFTPVEADAGAMGGSDSKTHEFQVIAETGEDFIVYTEDGSYGANIEKADTKRTGLEFAKADGEIKEIETPNMATIEDVCSFLKQPQHHSLKSLVYKGIKEDSEEVVLVLTLGDDQLNEIKLTNFLGADHIVPATEAELEEYGMPKGFIGPIGLKKEIRVIFDEAVDLDSAYVAGANKVDLHIGNLVPSRDVKASESADLRTAMEGDLAASGQSVKIKKGIEVGHIFQLGDKYTRAMDISVLDQNGKAAYPLMGCYGVGITRVAAAAIEQSHDDNGIIWHKSIAPFQLHFIAITKNEEFKQKANEIYEELNNKFEVLFDDRKVGPGFKFKDADLLGCPLQLVMGERDFKESGKLKIINRANGQETFAEVGEVASKVQELWNSL
jgi:prolyl-tRNA synthetase